MYRQENRKRGVISFDKGGSKQINRKNKCQSRQPPYVETNPYPTFLASTKLIFKTDCTI